MVSVLFPSGASRSYPSGIFTADVLADSELAGDTDRIIAVRMNNEIVKSDFRFVGRLQFWFSEHLNIFE